MDPINYLFEKKIQLTHTWKQLFLNMYLATEGNKISLLICR